MFVPEYTGKKSGISREKSKTKSSVVISVFRSLITIVSAAWMPCRWFFLFSFVRCVKKKQALISNTQHLSISGVSMVTIGFHTVSSYGCCAYSKQLGRAQPKAHTASNITNWFRSTNRMAIIRYQQSVYSSSLTLNTLATSKHAPAQRTSHPQQGYSLSNIPIHIYV